MQKDTNLKKSEGNVQGNTKFSEIGGNVAIL